MYEQLIAWAGLALLAVFCLPLAGVHKLVLEISAWALRLALLALLGAAAYLSFYPEQLPAEVAEALNDVPRLKSLLPDPMAWYFGICVVAPVVVALLPLLAVLDVTRKLAGRRLRRLRVLSSSPPTAAVHVPPRSGIIVRQVDRRTAADAIVTAGAGKPDRAGQRLAP
jgi:hypothetical protein